MPLLFGLATLVFFLSRVLPGDVTTVFLSPAVPPHVIDQLRSQFGLDRPLLQQYVLWIGSLMHGELGYSFTHGRPVLEVLLGVFPNTALLGGAALAIEVPLAIGITMLAVRRPGSLVDRLVSGGSLVVYTLPPFWIGIILLSLFSFRLGFFPSSHMYSIAASESGTVESLVDLISHLVLPAAAVAIPGAAGMVRYLRTSIGNVLNQDYVLAATSMGLPGRKIFRAYVLPNSLSPLVSLFGIEVGVLLTGVLVTETLFSWPGMGRITVLAIFSRDYPLVLGCTILAGIVVVLANFIADVVNALIDPRIRLPVGKR